MINSTEYIRLMSFLKHFGCNTREASTYIECLRMGHGSVQEIATRLNNNRITTHTTIQQLIKKGLLFETRKGKKRLIAAESPDVLYRILQRKSNDLKLIEKDLDYTTKLLYSLQSNDSSLSKVRLYEGEKDFKKILEETLTSQNNLCVFTSNELLSGITDLSYLQDYYKRLATSNIHARIIGSSKYVHTFKKNQLEYNFQIRYFPLLDNCNVGCYLWNDSLALISFQESRLICTVFQNSELFFFFNNFLFETIWKLSKHLT